MQDYSEPHIQIEATWCVTNCASGTQEQCNFIVSKNVIPILIQLLDSPYPSLYEQAIWCIGNIAGDSVKSRDECLKEGACRKVVDIYWKLKSSNAEYAMKLIAQVKWTLSNLCRSKPAPDLKHVFCAVPALCDAIKTGNNEVSGIADSVWALVQITNMKTIGKISESGVVPYLVAMLNSNQVVIVNPTLRILGNITNGTDEDAQICIDAGLVEATLVNMSHTHKIIRMECCWILSNLAAGCTKHKEYIAKNEPILNKLMVLAIEDNKEVAKEALWCLCNLSKDSSVTIITTM